MAYLFFVLISIFLFAGFILLTRNESKRGARYFADRRGALDAEVERWTGRVSEIDIAVFVRTGLRALVARIIHDIAHGSLIAVRFVEKLLTRTVRALRMQNATTTTTPSGNASSDFVATMKDFKQELRNGRKTEETTGDTIADKE
jgi:hypothetical protein